MLAEFSSWLFHSPNLLAIFPILLLFCDLIQESFCRLFFGLLADIENGQNRRIHELLKVQSKCLVNEEMWGEMGRALNPQFTSKNRGRLWMMTVKKSFAADCVFRMAATAKFVQRGWLMGLEIDGWIFFVKLNSVPSASLKNGSMFKRISRYKHNRFHKLTNQPPVN